MRIETMKLSQINPAPYNPRVDLKAGSPAYERIKNSLAEFGLVEPLVFNERTGNLVGGHQRYQILQDLGQTTATVSIVDLDENAEKALNIALNRAQGEWDETALELLIKELAQADMAEAAGFNKQDIDDLILKMQADQATADFTELMKPAVERPDQPPVEERITITLKAGSEVFTPEVIKELRGNYSHRGVEIKVERGSGDERSIRQGE